MTPIITCPNCNGMKRVPCHKCGNRAQWYARLRSRIFGPCKECHDKRTVECRRCSGSGYDKVPDPDIDGDPFRRAVYLNED